MCVYNNYICRPFNFSDTMELTLKEMMSYLLKEESWMYRTPTPLGDLMHLLTPKTISLWVKYVLQLCIPTTCFTVCSLCLQVVYGNALPAVPNHVPYSSFVSGTQPPQLFSTKPLLSDSSVQTEFLEVYNSMCFGRRCFK